MQHLPTGVIREGTEEGGLAARDRTDDSSIVAVFAGRRPARVTACDEEAVVKLVTSRSLASSLFVASMGGILLALVGGPGRFLVPPRPVHLTHHLVAMFTG